MFATVIGLSLLLATLPPTHQAEQDQHREFQYNSLIDNKGKYNFAYDTGNDNDIAHSLHMEYRDNDGIVRGRYGYTDPRGKLRIVEYEAGPDGYKVRGDVGPDQYPHAANPELSSLQMKPNPAPVQMAGWDPVNNPIDKSVPEEPVNVYPEDYNPPSVLDTFNYAAYPETVPRPGDSTQEIGDGNNQQNYSREYENYDLRYPRISYSSSDGNSSEEVEITGPENLGRADFVRETEPLTVYNIDVNPEDIRIAVPQADSQDLEAESSEPQLGSYQQADSDNQTLGRVKRKNYYQTPVRYVVRYPQGDYHDHSHDGHVHRQVHNHSVEAKYPLRQTHDHAAEYKYPLRQTHDHDAEYKYPLRQTHDHAAEYKYGSRRTHDHAAEYRYPSKQTHDHDAEVRYPSRYTHDHDAEVKFPSRDGSKYWTTRRIYYRDSHSMRPHEHGRAYTNDRYYGHYDRHLYGREGNSNYPATVRPNHLRYIPADRYHDKYYYWN